MQWPEWPVLASRVKKCLKKYVPMKNVCFWFNWYHRLQSSPTVAKSSFYKRFNVLMFCNYLMLIGVLTIIFEEFNSFIIIQIGVFSFLQPVVLFTHETIEMKMCFICKPDHRTLNPSLSIIMRIVFAKSNVCCIVSLGIAWCCKILYKNMCRLFHIIYCGLESFITDSTKVMWTDFHGFF